MGCSHCAGKTRRLVEGSRCRHSSVPGSVATAVAVLAKFLGGLRVNDPSRNRHVRILIGYVQYLRRIAEVERETLQWIEGVVDRSSRSAEAAWFFPQLASGCGWRDQDTLPWNDRRLVRDIRRRKHRSARR